MTAQPRRAALPWRRNGFFCLVLAILAMLAGCRESLSADLLEVVDVAPRQLEVGEQVEVLGTNLPSGNVQGASVIFRGTLHRAGAEPLELDELVIAGADPAPDRVTVTFTEELQAIFCGKGEQAVHTTFVGDVIVRFDATTKGGAGVQGTVRDVVLDVRAPPVRRSVAEARTARGEEASSFLGLSLRRDEDAAEGLQVAAIEPGSAAERAGIEAGDQLVRFDGVTVLTVADLVPQRGSRLARALVRRGDDELEVTLEVAGFDAELVPDDVLVAIVMLGLLSTILLLFMSPLGRFIAWVERRLALHLGTRKSRSGKGATSSLSLLRTLLRLRTDRSPGLAPYLVFVVVTASFVLMPLGKQLLSAELDVGLLYVIALSSLVVMGLLTGGSSLRWSPWGALRAALHLLASQLPALTAVVCVVVIAGSLRMHDVIAAQAGTGELLLGQGGWPWYWFVFRQPGNLLLFALFFTTATLEGQRDELPGAEGLAASRAGIRALLFLFADWLHVFVCCGLATALFLGGWLVPGVSLESFDAHLGWQALGTMLFLVKAWALVLTVIAVRRTLPRLRADQLVRLAWRWLVPLAALGAGACTAWLVGTAAGDDGQATLPGTAQTAAGVFTFGLCALLGLHLVTRLRRSIAERPALHLNPFL